MSKFLGLNRVCVPLSLDCDLSCRYCYRAAGRIPVVPEFNDLMREYISQLDPTKTQALVASGGEPLLHFNKVKELFSYAPKGQLKRVMTNGLNLTQEIVDYLNDGYTEVLLSHDGNMTEWLRGVDVLKDPELKALIMKIEHLTISCVCTAKNPDPYKCYLETKRVLNRPFYFHWNAVFADRFLHPELIDGFDYKAYRSGEAHCELLELDWKNPVKPGYKGVGVNVLPNGDLCGMAEIHHKYGTVLSTYEEVEAAKRAIGDMVACTNKDCALVNMCKKHGQNRSEHWCKCRQNTVALRTAIKRMELEDGTGLCL